MAINPWYTKRWPCPYCGAKNHFPENYPRSPFRDSSQHTKPTNSRTPGTLICGDFNNGHCIWRACNFQHICRLCKGPHPVTSAQTGVQPTKTSNTQLVPRWSLILECDQVHYKPSLPLKHTVHSSFQLIPSIGLEHLYTPSTQTLEHTACTTTSVHTHTRTPSTEAHGQILRPHVRTSATHAHNTISQQLQALIITHQLDRKAHTPIRFHALQTELTSHPNQTFIQQLIHNLQYGCNIGYTGPQFSHCSLPPSNILPH